METEVGHCRRVVEFRADLFPAGPIGSTAVSERAGVWSECVVKTRPSFKHEVF